MITQQTVLICIWTQRHPPLAIMRQSHASFQAPYNRNKSDQKAQGFNSDGLFSISVQALGIMLNIVPLEINGYKLFQRLNSLAHGLENITC